VWAQPVSAIPSQCDIITKGAANGESQLAWTGTSYFFKVNLVSSGWEGATSGAMGTGLVHIICVYEQGTQISLWINGSLAASVVPPNEDLFSGFPSNYSSIGAYLSDIPPHEFFNGVIDDVRIYNRALSNTEVQELFALEATPTPTASGTTTVLQQGDAAPGIAGAKFLTSGVPAVNNSMLVAFQATVTGTNTPATAAIGANNSGIWADDVDGVLQLIARTGTTAPEQRAPYFPR